MLTFLLECPKCKNRMKYQSGSIVLTEKKKRCVYCGHAYKVSRHIIKREC